MHDKVEMCNSLENVHTLVHFESILQRTVCYTSFNTKVQALRNGIWGFALQGIGNHMMQKLKSPT